MPFKLPKYKYFLAISDFFIVFITVFFSFYLIGPMKVYSFQEYLINSPGVIIISMVVGVFFVFIFQANNLYKINVFLTQALQLVAILKSLFYGAISLIIFAFLFKYSFLLNSRKFVILFLLISFVLLILIRLFVLRIFYMKFSKNFGVKRNVVILGAGKAGKLLSAKLLIEEGLNLNLVGFVDDNIEENTHILNGKKNLGRIDKLHEIIAENEIDEIIIAIDNIGYERLLKIFDICNSTEVLVKLTSELFEIVPEKIDTEKYSDIPVVNISPQMKRRFVTVIKRIVDIIGALLGVIILSPVFLLVSLLIKITSKGPVLYTHYRIGYKGKPFKFYKFRSMKPSPDDDIQRKEKMLKFMKEGTQQTDGDAKIINNDRVTWIGKIIRKTSIDELPQLINVLKGEMSLVGPRPCLPYEYENYDEWQKRRLDVLPGCTGVWQVFGRSNVSFKDSVVLDLYYINNMSPWLDLQLIIKTIPVMLFSKGGK